MKEFKSLKLILLTVFICAVLVLSFWIFTSHFSLISTKSDQFIQDKEALNRLLQNSSEIHRVWLEGEDAREWPIIKDQCLKYYQVDKAFDESLLRCRPMLIQCLALFSKNPNYHLVKPELNDSKNQKLYRYITKSNTSHVGIKNSGFLFTIEDNQSRQRLDLLLENNCQEVYLQNRAYAYGEEIEGKKNADAEDYRFDNFGQNIYIDRFLVTNDDVNEWIDFSNPDFTRGLAKHTGNDLFQPATQLSYSQMENFCSYVGKQVLEARFFDAATFLPMDMNDTLPKKNNRSPYYWTKKKSEFKADCNLIFAEDCLAKKTNRINNVNPSWAGLTDPMGGVFEVFRNPIDPESNLKASSFYFNFKSPWHKLGFRAGWDGEGFDSRHFDFKGIAPEKTENKYQVGFRCMRESK